LHALIIGGTPRNTKIVDHVRVQAGILSAG
jgi:hypothetical protein